MPIRLASIMLLASEDFKGLLSLIERYGKILPKQRVASSTLVSRSNTNIQW